MLMARFPSNIILRILEILNENSGIMRDIDLFEALRREFDLSYNELMKYIMILEIRGYVHVSSSRENLRVITLNPRVREHLVST